MWKRILAWQIRSNDDSLRGKSSDMGGLYLARPSLEMPAFLAAQKSGVAVQRELAKVMW